MTYIFDLDDTLIDSSIYSRIYQPIINTLLDNLDINEMELQKVISEVKEGQRVDTLKLCKRLHSTELYYKVLERYVRHTYSLKTKSIPSLFKKIKQAGKKVGVVSNSEERTIELFLTRFNLMEYVDFIESGKKDTVLFWVTLERRHGLNKSQTMVIDDSDDILEVARHAGYKVLNVRNLEDIEGFSL